MKITTLIKRKDNLLNLLHQDFDLSEEFLYAIAKELREIREIKEKLYESDRNEIREWINPHRELHRS